MRPILGAMPLLLTLAPTATAQVLPTLVPPPSTASAPEVEGIVITAPRRAVSATGPFAVDPQVVLDEHDIGTYGADTINDLLDAISPQTRGAGSAEGPLVLVNGRLAPNLGGLGAVPPEALQRIEILPDGPSLNYGQRPGQRVVNLVLRDKYAAITADADHGEATDGARPSSDLKANVVRIYPDGRWSLDAGYSHEAALLEADRGLTGDDTRYTTLLPRLDEWSLAGGYDRKLSNDVDATATGNFTTSRLHGLLGLDAPGEVIGSETGIRTANLGLAVQGGTLKGWQWSVTATFDSNNVRNDITGQQTPASDEADQHTAALEALFTGSAFKAPAGPIGVTVKLRLDESGISSRASGSTGQTTSRLQRESGFAQLNVDVPIARRGGGFLGHLGDLTLNANAKAERLSDLRGLNAVGAGLTWAPFKGLTAFGQVTQEDLPPSLQQLGAPLFATPGFQTYDYVRNESVVVSRIDGGNPALRPVRQRQVRLGVTYQPTKTVTFSATYSDRRDGDQIVTFPTATAEVQQAFPDRFTRGPGGALTQIDERPINVSGADVRELLTSADVRLPWPGSHNPSDRIDVSVTHTWWLRDQLTIAPGVPVLDFLNGSVGENGAARPRHQLTLQAGGSHGGMGARIQATWQSATQVSRPTGGPLSFSSLAVANVKLFFDLDKIGRKATPPAWMKGLRLSLDVDNVLNTRQRVRDALGETPFAYEPAFLDPLGREVLISVRKQF